MLTRQSLNLLDYLRNPFLYVPIGLVPVETLSECVSFSYQAGVIEEVTCVFVFPISDCRDLLLIIVLIDSQISCVTKRSQPPLVLKSTFS